MVEVNHLVRTNEVTGLRYFGRPCREHRVPRWFKLISLIATILVAEGCGRADRPIPTVETARKAGHVVPVEIPPSLEQIARGRQIYLTGESPSGRKISGVIGANAEVPARLLACGNCHGRDGRGTREGAIAPSNLTWTTLTRPYGLDRPNG